MRFLSTRQRQPEWLDEPDADPRDLQKSLAYIRKINRLLGYDRLIVHHLRRFSARWKPGQTIRILDVGTGSADIPLAILRWGEQSGFDIRITGIDLNARIVAEATDASRAASRLSIVRGDALQLPFEAGSFDYAITSMFLHHLDDADAARALSEMARVARRGIIASDLLRLRRSYAFICVATLFSNPMVKHDARVSVAQAFNRAEVLAMREGAGVVFAEYHTHLSHRFVLAGERERGNGDRHGH